MKFIAIGLIAVLFLNSCSQTNPTQTLLAASNLPSQQFSITPGKDTTLQTLHGSKINILAGTFAGTALVSVTIKEALTPAEILAAGLTTTSNGKPLRSAGMIYFNATADNKTLKLQKPVKISLPNNYYDSAMQVFKGEETAEGINWVDPQPTDTSKQKQCWNNGRMIYWNNCASCHAITREGIGPALAGVFTNPIYKDDKKRLYHFIRKADVLQATDPYYTRLKKQYGGAVMTAFPALKDSVLDDLFYYIKSRKAGDGEDEFGKRYLDSLNKAQQSGQKDSVWVEGGLYEPAAETPCKTIDTIYYPEPKNDTSSLSVIEPANITLPAIDTPPPAKPGRRAIPEQFDMQFTDPNPTNGYYDFEIKTNGWYNVDAFFEGFEGTKFVKIQVSLQMQIETDMHVYLFCPERKMLSVAYTKTDGNYVFDKIDNKVPLFPGDRTLVFAFGSSGQKMFYGITSFRVNGDQLIQIDVKETTEEEIRKALQAQQLDGIHLGIDKKIEQIIERPCNETRPVAPDTISMK